MERRDPERGLSVLGLGLSVPPPRPTREVAAELGADTTNFRGWPNVCIASDDQHPSTMGAEALSSALDAAGVRASALDLVISAGMSRDYPPSWSVSTEVMKLVGAPSSAFGLDLTSGCLGTLAALDVALGLLDQRGGGYAAVLATERWSYTVDRSSTETMSLWAHSDGGGAMVVGRGVSEPALSTYLGAEYRTYSELNGRVLIKYGGTRHPQVPDGVDANFRQLGTGSARAVRQKYLEGYGKVLAGARNRFGLEPDRLICNQITPGIVGMLSELAGVPPEKTVVTGNAVGHLGPGDVIYGLHTLARAGEIDGPVAVAASTPYAFGAGMLIPA